MFLRASSRQSAKPETRAASRITSWVAAHGSVRFLSGTDTVGRHEEILEIPATDIALVHQRGISASAKFDLREIVGELFACQQRVGYLEAALQRRDNTLDRLEKVMANQMASESIDLDFIPELITDAKYALLCDNDVKVRWRVEEQVIASRLSCEDEYIDDTLNVLNGEMMVYKSAPYLLIVESPDRISSPVKSLIKLFINQVASIERRERNYVALKNARELEWMALHDSLTELPNRRMLDKTLNDLKQSAGDSANTHAIMCLDLDRFKQINDRLGHAIGDQLLVRVSRLFQNLVRDTDTVCRVGGDEFIVVCPNIVDLAVVQQLADRMIEAVSMPHIIQDSHCRIGLSIGIAVWQASTSWSVEDLLMKADGALYMAKENGRNGYRLASGDDAAPAAACG